MAEGLKFDPNGWPPFMDPEHRSWRPWQEAQDEEFLTFYDFLPASWYDRAHRATCELARPDLFRRLTMAEKVETVLPYPYHSELHMHLDVVYRSTQRRPNFWWRMWQYLLLGWRWKKIGSAK